MLDYRINTFLTLYREMNYRKTAALLNMTQPGVTQHIQFLEAHYGVKLFSYNGKTLTRTPQADILKRHIDSILLEEKEILLEFSQQKKNILNIGATKTIGEFVLGDVVRQFLQDESNSINLMVDNTETLLRSLERAELDFAVVEGVFDKTKYPSHLYKKEHFVGICAKDHPFAGKVVTLQDTFSQTLILREPGSGTRKILEDAITQSGYSLDCYPRVISVSNFSVISDMVMQGDSITFAYAPVAQSRPGLAVFRVEDIRISGEFNFVYCNEHIAREKIAQLFGSL